MKETTARLLDRAEQAIATARRLLAEPSDVEAATGRAYYAMFYVAEALLFERGLSFRKHSGVHAAFGQHFARSGALDPKHHRRLLDAFDKRVVADYGIEPDLTTKDVWRTIEHAEELFEVAHCFLLPERP